MHTGGIFMKKTVEKLTSWLKDQVDGAGMKGLIVGVSGGLDSAVVAYLIKRAFPDNSIGVIMPLNSNPSGMEHAQKVIDGCGIEGVTIDLTAAHKQLLGTIQEKLQDNIIEHNRRLADANLRARLRMSTLYTVATNFNYLVVGTDNAAEWYTGYFTKYGDGGVDLLPLKEFTKGEVRELASYLGVPDEIIQKQPSADLWEGQTDEEEMGISYDTIDAFLQGKQISQQERTVIERMHQRTEHKRSPLPYFSRTN